MQSDTPVSTLWWRCILHISSVMETVWFQIVQRLHLWTQGTVSRTPGSAGHPLQTHLVIRLWIKLDIRRYDNHGRSLATFRAETKAAHSPRDKKAHVAILQVIGSDGFERMFTDLLPWPIGSIIHAHPQLVAFQHHREASDLLCHGSWTRSPFPQVYQCQLLLPHPCPQ